MYEAVRARPDGESTVARMVARAAALGYEGVVVRNHGDRDAEFDAADLSERYGVDVVRGVEIRTNDRPQASSLVARHRDRDVVAFHGGPLNRFALERDRVDVLAHPMVDGDVNHVLAGLAREHGVRLEFNLGPVLRSEGGRRVTAIRGLRKLRELVEQYDAPYVVSGDPASHLELRAPRELVAVGERLGFDAEQVREGLREWGRIAARAREVRSEEFIEPGVRTGRYEEEPR